MTREEAIDIIKCLAWHTRPNEEDIEQAIKALEQELCEDVISRQAVLDLQYRIDDSATLSTRDVVNVEDIEDLPPVKPPKPKTGYWIYDRTRDWDGECKYECSECGMGSDVDYDYCMRCGAKMTESEDKE